MKIGITHLRAAVHLGATLVLAVVITQGTQDWNADEGLDPMLECGKWALRMLLLCLAVTPLVRLFGWPALAQLRKPLGLWAFAFAGIHLLLYVRDDPALARWQAPVQPFMLLGALALLILTALAATSNKPAMRRLGRAWKRLHRLVYLAGGATAAHALLAAISSKKMFVRDPQAMYELQLNAALLTIMLAVRVPAVWRLLQPAVAPLRRPRMYEPPAAPPGIPERIPPMLQPVIPPAGTAHKPILLEAEAADEQLEETLCVP
jgi:sulfoxide reductase heme-binding subunit YedZ